MSDADIILIFIGIISLLIAFGQLIVAFLAFLTRDKDHKRKKLAYSVGQQNRQCPKGQINLFLGSIHFGVGAFPLSII